MLADCEGFRASRAVSGLEIGVWGLPQPFCWQVVIQLYSNGTLANTGFGSGFKVEDVMVDCNIGYGPAQIPFLALTVSFCRKVEA